MAKPSVTVDETTLLGVRFIRWGLGLFIFGLIFCFGLLGYYFHSPVERTMISESGAQWLNYPWTLATYILQVGGLSIAAIGAVYWLLPGDKLETESVDYTALWLCIVGLISTFLTSYVGKCDLAFLLLQAHHSRDECMDNVPIRERSALFIRRRSSFLFNSSRNRYQNSARIGVVSGSGCFISAFAYCGRQNSFASLRFIKLSPTYRVWRELRPPLV